MSLKSEIWVNTELFVDGLVCWCLLGSGSGQGFFCGLTMAKLCVLAGGKCCRGDTSALGKEIPPVQPVAVSCAGAGQES